MGIIYNEKVKESKIFEAYGLTVYGKINRYIWSYRDEEENALITIRIVDTSGKDIFSMYLGNNCIFQCRIDDTLDNFLWWIAEDYPEEYFIEQQVYKSLCASDSLFNHKIRQRKEQQKREEEEKKRIAEREKTENEAINCIKAYCDKNGFIPHFTYEGVYIIKTLHEKAYDLIMTADSKQMEDILSFMNQCPENKDGYIVKFDTMENILSYIAA